MPIGEEKFIWRALIEPEQKQQIEEWSEKGSYST